MWIFNKDGFFSVVEIGDDKQRVMVRGRFKKDMVKLKKKLVPSSMIHETPEADYRFRIMVFKTDWAAYLKRSAEEIDYKNFKDSVPDKHKLYMEVWWVMRKAQGIAGLKL